MKATHVQPDLTPPQGPPHPTLTALGFLGSLQEFNQRLEAVTAAHVQTFGNTACG